MDTIEWVNFMLCVFYPNLKKYKVGFHRLIQSQGGRELHVSGEQSLHSPNFGFLGIFIT